MPKIYLEPNIGVSLSYLSVVGAKELGSSILPYGGFSFGFVPGVSEINWVYHLGLKFNSYRFDEFYNTEDLLPQYYAPKYHFVYNFKKVSLPILIEYNIGLKHFNTSIFAGGNVGLMFDQDNQISKMFGGAVSEVPMRFEYGKYSYGLEGGIGFNYELENRDRIALNMIYSFSSSLIVYDPTYIHALQVGLVYSFLMKK